MASLFIVGSGFTHAATSGCAPLNSSVMKALRAVPSSPWKSLSRRYSTNDVEVALTRLDMDILAARRPKALQSQRRKAEDSLAEFFARYRYSDRINVQSPWLLKFIASAFARGDVVVSLNYDCLLEGALDVCGLWSPVDGYGRSSAIASVPTGSAPSAVRVLKIHGSENFHRDRVGDSRCDRSFSVTIDESIFPKSGKHRHFCLPDIHSSTAIIAPSFVKTLPSPLLSACLEALEAASAATTIVVIGCALRPEDAFLYLLLWRFVRKGRRIIIVDPSARDIGRRLSETFEYDISAIVHAIDHQLSVGWEQLVKTL